MFCFGTFALGVVDGRAAFGRLVLCKFITQLSAENVFEKYRLCVRKRCGKFKRKYSDCTN